MLTCCNVTRKMYPAWGAQILRYFLCECPVLWRSLGTPCFGLTSAWRSSAASTSPVLSNQVYLELMRGNYFHIRSLTREGSSWLLWQLWYCFRLFTYPFYFWKDAKITYFYNRQKRVCGIIQDKILKNVNRIIIEQTVGYPFYER